MTTPIDFSSSSARFGLPLLFAGQAQKEFFVNQAHVLADTLLHPAISGKSASPPPAPAPGETWLVSAEGTGDWLGKDDSLASWQSGLWIFVAPVEGMQLFDTGTGQYSIFKGGQWAAPLVPPAPDGGAVIDAEARAAISSLITNLRISGIFPSI